MIIADQSLYPSDPSDPDAPGQHRAIIEQVFAARELGVNAATPVGGKQTISTRVSDLVAAQGKLAAPTGVNAALASPTSVSVSWQPVAGAFAYEILKREIGREEQRVNVPVKGREYIDGDGGTDGYLHVEYVPANETGYVDNGSVEGAFVPRGLKLAISGEYVVRALSINPNTQLFTFDAVVTARVQVAPAQATRYQPQPSGSTSGSASATGAPASGGSLNTNTATNLVRFSVNPLTGQITSRVLR